MIQSRLFLLRDNNFIHGALSDLKLCMMFSFTSLHERSFSKIHNRGTLRYFWLNPRAFCPCIDSNTTTTFKAQEGSKDIIKIVHVTSEVQP